MDYVRVNKLWIKPQYSTSVVQPHAVQLGSNKKYRLTKGNTVVWDVLRTTFNAYDFTIGAEGGYVPNYSSVDSYGLNYLNQIEYLDWDCDIYWIDENTSTSPVTHYITYTQEGTGEQVTVVCTQEGKEQDITVTGYRYEAVVTKEDIGKAPATNSYTTLSLKVSGTIYIYEQYSDGTESYYGRQDFSSVTAHVYDGSSTTGAYVTTGNVIVPPVGTTTYMGDRVAFTITKYYFDMLGESFHETTSLDVYQAENKITGQEWGTSASDYSLSISSSVSSFTSNGGTATITVQCQQRYRDVYTSGSRGEWVWGNGTASISTSYGNLNKSSITGKDTATLTVGKDYGTGTTAVVTANAGNGTKTAIVSITQAKRVATSTSYGVPSIVNAYQDANIPAWGGYAYLMVDWSQTKTTTYDNNTTSTSPVTGTSQAIILSGTIQQSGASVQSDGGLYKNSCGTTVTPQRTVYTVKSYKFTANEVTRTISNTAFNIGQAANKQESTSWFGTYNISISHSPTGNIANTGGTKTISVSSTENGKITYTSTATQNTTRNATATLSTSLGTLSITSITGSGTSTLTVGENISAQRSITVTAKSGSTSKTTTIIQNAVVYVLTAGDDVEANATATTVDVTFVSSRNGSPWQPTFSSDVSWATVKFKSSSGNTFTVTVTLAANTSTSTRTATITATQTRYSDPGTATLTVTQAGKAVALPKFGVLLDECVYTNDSLSYVSYSIRFTASPSSSYAGGTASNVIVQLNTMPNGSGSVIASKTLTSSLTVNKGNTSSTYSGTLSADGRICYFLVYWDNTLQFYTDIEENVPEV